MDALSILRSTVADNLVVASAPNGSSGADAAAAHGDSISIVRSSLRGNSANAFGTATAVDGAILDGEVGPMQLTRTAISENSVREVSTNGGASSDVDIEGLSVTLTRSTVDRNSTTLIATGGDVYADGTIGETTFTSTASTISRSGSAGTASTFTGKETAAQTARISSASRSPGA